MTQEMIARINALAKKSREQGLTDAEQAEQTRLRRAYLDAVRGSLKSHLDATVLVDAAGNRIPLKQKGTRHTSE